MDFILQVLETRTQDEKAMEAAPRGAVTPTGTVEN
jgi:hypothetical protein